MIECQGLPSGLAGLPPGPELAAVLASIDRTRLVGPDLCVVLRARARQVAHEQAHLLADLLELALTPGEGLERTTKLDEFSADPVAMELTWSRAAAQAHVLLAQDLRRRLPVVYDALLAGRIDLPRARAFSEALSQCDDETAAALAQRFIGKAERWTCGILRERLRYHVLRADPTQAKKRYEAQVADRRVYLQPFADGTATLGALGLPPDRAAAAYDRLDRLARAAKASGDGRCLPQLRSDAFLDLLEGRVFTTAPSTDPITAAADASLHNGPSFPTGAATRPTASGRATPLAHSGPATADPAPAAASGIAGPDGVCSCGGVRPAPRRGTVDVQVQLTTLMCLDDDPGLIPGWGPVIADIARQVAHDQDTNPTWRYSVTDAYGQLLHHGVTTRRPTARRPTAREASFVAARDRTCRAPGCRQPAARCDQDHRREHARGGPANRGNLCTLCRHHHRLRHERGYTNHQIGLGTTLWHTPHGRHHIVAPDATLLLAGQDTDYPDPGTLYNAWSQADPVEAPDHVVDANGPPPEAFDEPEDWTPETWAAMTERLVDWTPTAA